MSGLGLDDRFCSSSLAYQRRSLEYSYTLDMLTVHCIQCTVPNIHTHTNMCTYIYIYCIYTVFFSNVRDSLCVKRRHQAVSALSASNLRNFEGRSFPMLSCTVSSIFCVGRYAECWQIMPFHNSSRMKSFRQKPLRTREHLHG